MTKDRTTTRQTGSHRRAARLGLGGSTMGMVAGLVQATVGTRIPEWTGSKDSTIALGALTVVLSAIAALGATRLRTPEPPTAAPRVAVIVAFVVPAVLGFTTVGRLWYLPGALLLAASASTAADGNTRDLLAVVRANWTRGLVSLLGTFVVLMAVSASRIPTLAIGVSGGLVVIAAPWLARRTERVVAIPMLMAAIPFAVITWWSIASPLVALLALLIGMAVIRDDTRPGQINQATVTAP